MQVSAWMVFSSPPATPIQGIALMHHLFSSLQLKPISSLNPKKPCRNLAMTQLCLVLLGGCKDRRGDWHQRNTVLLEHPLKHFCPHRISTLFWGPDEAASFRVQDFVRLNPQYNLSLLNCCDLTGCWQALPVSQALKTLALTLLDMGPSITPAWNCRQPPTWHKKTAAWLEPDTLAAYRGCWTKKACFLTRNIIPAGDRDVKHLDIWSPSAVLEKGHLKDVT